MMPCGRCGGALERQIDPMDLHGGVDLVCVMCGRSATVTVRVAEPEKPAPIVRVARRTRVRVKAPTTKSCDWCGKEFTLDPHHWEARFCSPLCGNRGRGKPRREVCA